MVTLVDLWLPIVASAVAVFFISFAMWMVLPHHKGDWSPLPDEGGTMDALRERGVQGGRQYTFPHCADNSQWKDPAFIKKWEDGPSGFLIVRPTGHQSMPKNMLVSFCFNLIVITLVAYVATVGLTTASSSTDVMRLVTTTAFLGFAGALGGGAIWFARSFRSTLLEALDGLAYGLATGLIFMLLWPSAALPV